MMPDTVLYLIDLLLFSVQSFLEHQPDISRPVHLSRDIQFEDISRWLQRITLDGKLPTVRVNCRRHHKAGRVKNMCTVLYLSQWDANLVYQGKICIFQILSASKGSSIYLCQLCR